jgi:acid phosphatase (class A)
MLAGSSLQRTGCVLERGIALFLTGCLAPSLLLTTALFLQTAFAQPADAESAASPMRRSAAVSGYLAEEDYPDSAALLPPPPAPGSNALALDEELNNKMLRLRGTARWDLAASDARTRFPEAASLFSCALGVPITEEGMPRLYKLLRRTVADVGAAVTPTKRKYQRKRPFLVNKQPICTPRAEQATARDGAYPSGHTAAGWLWALILAEIAPSQTDAVLARGWEYGQSRAVCNVHWQSDVDQGRVVGAALVARLHANEEFRADLEGARQELADMREKDRPPNRDCEAEALALEVAAPVD